MATGQLTKGNCSYDSRVVCFFGAKGMKLNNGKWRIKYRDGASWLVVDPSGIANYIHRMIMYAALNGTAHLITRADLDPESAVTLFLEGVITPGHLKGAIEDAEFVDIPGVTIDGHVLTVHVTPDASRLASITDEHGQPF